VKKVFFLFMYEYIYISYAFKVVCIMIPVGLLCTLPTSFYFFALVLIIQGRTAWILVLIIEADPSPVNYFVKKRVNNNRILDWEILAFFFGRLPIYWHLAENLLVLLIWYALPILFLFLFFA